LKIKKRDFPSRGVNPEEENNHNKKNNFFN